MALIRQRKLSKQQLRRIKQQQNQHIDDASLLTGVVMAHYGKQLEVQITQLPNQLPSPPVVKAGEPEPFWQPIQLHDVWRCHARTNLSMIATGDKVRWTADPNTGLGRIESILQRHSIIERPDRYHKIKPVVTNIDLLAIVFAHLPAPAASLIDRYLLISHHYGIPALLILNKADLLQNTTDGDNHSDSNSNSQQVTQALFNEYQALGYQTVLTSAIDSHTNQHHIPNTVNATNAIDINHSLDLDDATPKDSAQGLSKLRDIIAGKMVVFAGQSGVGKSSLINQLLPNSDQSINVISQNSQLGQHTTTTSRLLPFDAHDLTQGGIIDTPGIREYGIWHLSPNDIMAGFPELAAFAGQCRFRDCQHTPNTKGCALQQAIHDGAVLKRRVDSLITLQQEANTKDY